MLPNLEPGQLVMTLQSVLKGASYQSDALPKTPVNKLSPKRRPYGSATCRPKQTVVFSHPSRSV